MTTAEEVAGSLVSGEHELAGMSHQEFHQQKEQASAPTAGDQETNSVQVTTEEQFNVVTEGLSDDSDGTYVICCFI